MGSRYKEYGGGPAVGLASNWINDLQSFMRGGSTPAGQMTRAGQNQGMAGTADALTNTSNGPGGIYNIIQDILSQGAGKVGGHLGSSIARQQESDRKGLRAQFSSIGGGYGSGAAQARARYDAQSADDIPLGIANLQMGVIGPLLQMIQQMSMRGVTQRQGVMEQNPWLQGAQALGGIARTAGSLMGPGANPIPPMPAPVDLSGVTVPTMPNFNPNELPPIPGGY